MKYCQQQLVHFPHIITNQIPWIIISKIHFSITSHPGIKRQILRRRKKAPPKRLMERNRQSRNENQRYLNDFMTYYNLYNISGIKNFIFIYVSNFIYRFQIIKRLLNQMIRWLLHIDSKNIHEKKRKMLQEILHNSRNLFQRKNRNQGYHHFSNIIWRKKNRKIYIYRSSLRNN